MSRGDSGDRPTGRGESDARKTGRAEGGDRPTGRRDRADRLREIMDAEGDAIGENTRTVNQLSAYTTGQFDRYEQLREEAREIKEQAIADLPDLIDRVTASVRANGGRVHLASDAAAASEYVADVLAEAGADSLVKSKSMTTEEIDLNDHLESQGVNVVETDLGEFVIQVADEAPSHLIGPAMHRSPEDIAELFNAQFDPDDPLEGDPHELTEFAREHIGERIRQVDAGLTGANFVVAETGTIALVTNEGNARKSAVTPDVHVAVAGIEKIIPTVADLQPFVELIARSGTGQDITSYVSLLTPPVDTPTVDFEANELGAGGGDAGEDRIDGSGGDPDREFHLVLLDNGRMAMREDEHLRETLYCIRCGACANSCANFQSVGGHAFGGETYTGGIATGWEAGVHGQDSAAEFNDLCTGCTRCVNRCPVKIDIPWINTVVRDRINRGADADRFEHLVEGLTPDEEPAGMDLQKRAFGNVDSVARLGHALPFANRLAESGPVRRFLSWAAGIDPRRPLPSVADTTLREWYGARGPRVDDPDREVVLYPDLYTDYFRVDRGKAAVRTLEALGARVHLPPVAESGRAPLSQGMVETADERASEVYGALAEHLDRDRDVVVIEPSDLAMFVHDYRRLLPAESFERLSGASHGVMEYVDGLLDDAGRAGGTDALPDPGDRIGMLAGGDGAGDGDATVVYHGHCQERTLGLADHVTSVLDECGWTVRTTNAECCGMAGSFGYKREYYEVSVDVGEHLADEVGDRAVLAGGASCQQQLEDLLDRPVPHPIEAVDPG